MISKVFTVWDAKAEAYASPFVAQTVGLATRTFEDLVNTPDHQFCKYPDDYSLVEIGEYDDSTGRITPHENFRELGKAREYKKAELAGSRQFPFEVENE